MQAPILLDLSNFRVVRHVTRPLLKLQENKQYYIKVDEPMKQADPVTGGRQQKGADGNPVPPPFIMAVTNLEDGVAYTMIANEVLKTELEKQYPSHGYVGKFFELSKNTKAEGKRYNTFGITELAPVEDQAAITETHKDGKKKAS